MNACKKKNTLYKDFVKHRTEEKEIKYKTYKNKLTAILRKCKKDYYSRLLETNKNNIKGTWNILNSIIRRKKTSTGFPNEFIDNGKIIKNMDEVVAGFNGFFVNVGPNLADEIIPPQKGDVPQFSEERNPATIFLRDTDKTEVLDIVNMFKNKTSRDCNDIDMFLIKQLIVAIVDPIVYISNLSLKLGSFPTNMKIAKVVPIFKAGEQNLYTNYRPISLLPQFSKILEKIFSIRLDSFLINMGS